MLQRTHFNRFIGYAIEPTRRGFTLVELLVVVAIIALLLSILLPALGKARATAEQVACQSNLRQVGMGFSFYGSDHRQYMPALLTSPNPSQESRDAGYTAGVTPDFILMREYDFSDDAFACASSTNNEKSPETADYSTQAGGPGVGVRNYLVNSNPITYAKSVPGSGINEFSYVRRAMFEEHAMDVAESTVSDYAMVCESMDFAFVGAYAFFVGRPPVDGTDLGGRGQDVAERHTVYHEWSGRSADNDFDDSGSNVLYLDLHVAHSQAIDVSLFR